MVTYHIRKTIHFLSNVSGGYSTEYLATAALVEKVDHPFDSFNGVTRVDPGKNCVAHSEITVPICIIGKSKYGDKEFHHPEER
jgi:hypothetical protein